MRSVAGAGDFTLLCSGLGEHISASTVSSYRIVVLSEGLMRARDRIHGARDPIASLRPAPGLVNTTQ